MPATETSAGVTFLFTVIGGVTTVVRVDVVQMLLYVTGGLIAIVLIASSIGTGWLGEAAEAGRTQLVVWLGNPLSADDSFLVSDRTCPPRASPPRSSRTTPKGRGPCSRPMPTLGSERKTPPARDSSTNARGLSGRTLEFLEYLRRN
ncbi:MAG: hypothetical protein L0H74_08520 [Brachybacterium sp.]|nr:hypothetical protein [Brachybacterium sp.]